MGYVDSDKILRKMQKIATVAWQMKLKANVETVWNDAMDIIRFAPSADVAPVVHGEWIKAEVVELDEISECHSPYWKCSVCGRAYAPYSASSFQFCPNCGAKMDGDGK